MSKSFVWIRIRKQKNLDPFSHSSNADPRPCISYRFTMGKNMLIDLFWIRLKVIRIQKPAFVDDILLTGCENYIKFKLRPAKIGAYF